MSFGNRLQELRFEKELTQKDVGNALFISERVISYYESGQRFPNDPNTLIQIAEYFHVSIDYLLGTSPFRNRTIPDIMVKMTRDLALLISCYASTDDMNRGRILQFAIDLTKIEKKK